MIPPLGFAGWTSEILAFSCSCFMERRLWFCRGGDGALPLVCTGGPVPLNIVTPGKERIWIKVKNNFIELCSTCYDLKDGKSLNFYLNFKEMYY